MRRVFILLLPLGLVGCAAQDIARRDVHGLIERFGQADQADSRRLAVLDELLSRQLSDEQGQLLGQTLAAILASHSHSPDIRSRAAALAVERYSQQAPVWLAEGLDATSPGPLRDDFIAKILQINDPRPVPRLMVLLAEQTTAVHLADAPEGRAIEQLAQRPLADCCRDVFIGDYALREKLAGLYGLIQSIGYERVLQEAAAWPEGDFIVAEVRFWARRFSYLPANVPRLLMGQVQRHRLSPEQFILLHERSRQLREQFDYRFDVRDSYLLVRMNESDLHLSPAALTEDIAAHLAVLSHTKRPASYPGSIDDYRESFADQAHYLSMPDLLRIRILLDTLALPAVARNLRDLLRRDIHDINSEAGGLCFLDAGGYGEFQSYAPGGAQGDKHYIESAALLTDAALCLARWHAHVDPFRGREIAGPGPDDLHYARTVNTPVVILTLLENDRFNVDFLVPEGRVIDLGDY